MTRNDRPPPTRRGVHELRYVRHQPAGRTALGQLAFNDAKTMPYLAQMAAERRKIVALIPAHNEEDAICDTITSLNGQDLLPDRIIIVADNCSDDTELIACAAGVEVMATRDNPWKKAGALNQALDRILPELKDRDLVLIQDADTNLNPGFLSSAVAAMTDDAGGVCAQLRQSAAPQHPGVPAVQRVRPVPPPYPLAGRGTVLVGAAGDNEDPGGDRGTVPGGRPAGSRRGPRGGEDPRHP